MSVRLLKRRFTVEEYHRMAQAGILSEDDRVELIEGEIVEMVPIGSRHAASVNRLTNLLSELVGKRAIVSVQNPVRLGPYAEPQPDVALLRPRNDFYAPAHPGPQDALLVVEVAETSADYDREIKMALYARAGVPEAWLVDLQEGVVEVHRSPAPDGYRRVQQHRPGQHLSPEVSLAVDEVLG